MNSKNIKAVLSRKFNDFLDSIDDKDVKALVKKNSIITGGCIVSMLLKEDINDYDIYFTNKETALAVAKYYVEKFRLSHPDKFAVEKDNLKVDVVTTPDNQERIKIFIRSAGVVETDDAEIVTDETEAMDYLLDDEVKEEEDAKEKPKYRPLWLSANAISLSHKIQLIIRFHGNADEIHQNYDFVHCTSYWCSDDNYLHLRPEALEALLAKELRYIGSKYPVCSIIRTRKFLKRGFTINAGQYFKMCLQVSQLNLLDIKVLEDQLIGVDSAYFNQVINTIQEKKENDPTWEFDSSYLVEIINRVF